MVHAFMLISKLVIMPTNTETHAQCLTTGPSQNGGAYLAPAAVKNPDTILAGTLYFSPDEVEVFYLDHTQ